MGDAARKVSAARIPIAPTAPVRHNSTPSLQHLTGIRPNESLGYFIDPFGVADAWEYRDGASWLQGKVFQSVSNAYQLRRPQPKVAVLQNSTISSSGEATLITFRQRPNTRSFGSWSCGFSTANLGFRMADGGMLLLTVSTMADRNKTMFGDCIAPDEEIADTALVVSWAVQWLMQQ